jgi:catechol 2,3-dioxygenase-like lactoylglutathione lyase family enzyme
MILAHREPLGHAGCMVPAAVRECANILGLSHVELLVGDLDRSRAFYVDLLGFTEAERDRDRLYLRCVEDRQHHSLVLRRAARPGLGHIAYKVADDGSLDAMARRFADLGLSTRWLAAGEERAVGRALRVTFGSVVLVPPVEELFWRGWLMRWLIRPDNFHAVRLGAYSHYSFWTTAILFAAEHGPYWDVGLIAGVLYNWWMVRTRSLADCTVAHAITNGLLAVYVLYAGHWQYWL